MLLMICLLTACGSKKKEETYDDGLPVLTLALRSGIYSDVISESVLHFEEQEKVHCKILSFPRTSCIPGLRRMLRRRKEPMIFAWLMVPGWQTLRIRVCLPT